MNMYKKIFIALTCALIAFNSTACSSSTETTAASPQSSSAQTSAVNEASYFTDDELNAEYDSASAKKISLNGTSAVGEGVAIDGNKISITTSGVYEFTGNLDNGQIIVNCQSEGDVQIVLNNASITCTDSAPIYIEQASNTILTLPEGTENFLADGESYILNSDDEPSATVFSKDDLLINGTGTLTISSNRNDAVKSNDTLKIASAVINITSADDGIVGKDLLAVAFANITINAQGDGMKASNDTDDVTGIIAVESGIFNIKSENDGLQAESGLIINDGTFTIVTGGGSNSSDTNFSEASESVKGLKASGEITVNGGTFSIDSLDDSIHSNGNIIINAGTFAIAAGDDGLHADEDLTINSGAILISTSYEGIEGNNITINGGDIDITSSDDGINVAGGNDSSAAGGRHGQDSFGESSSHTLTINGGTISLNAMGDGIDVNGSAIMTDGYVTVNGPTSSGNSALDYDETFEISGGTLCAFGSIQMAQTPSSSSTAPVFSLSFDSNMTSGTVISIQSAEENKISSFTAAKDFQNVIIASSSFNLDTEYTVLANGNAYVTFVPTESITYLNSSGIIEGGMQNGQGGFPSIGGRKPKVFTDGNTPEGMTPPSDGEFPKASENSESKEAPPSGRLPDGTGERPSDEKPKVTGGNPPNNGELPPEQNDMPQTDSN